MNKYMKEFNDYYDKFNSRELMVKMKFFHSLRVVKLSMKIAQALGLSDDELEVVYLGALLHDVARFLQWQEFKTYDDNNSFDHGDKGVEILVHEINKYTDDKDMIDKVNNIVKYHNKYEIPDDIDEKSKLYLKIVRDADKLDIIDLHAEDAILYEKSASCFSKKVKESFYNKKSINNDIMETDNDVYVRSFAMVFDINFNETLIEYNKLDLTKRAINTVISNNNHLEEELLKMKDFIDVYVEERLG